MKRSLVVFGIVFLLMVSIAYAGFLDYYGKIEGIAEVSGPIFYTSPEKKLLINEESAAHITYKITNGESIIFWTEENLGGINFNYMPKADLYIRAKVNNAIPPKSIELIFGYSDTSGIMHDICFSTVDVTSTELSDYHTFCSGSVILLDVNKFYYKMQGRVDPSIEYSVDTMNTRIEVSV